MTASAPMARTMAALVPLDDVPTTHAPRCFSQCTNNCPTPPAAEWTSTRSPGRTFRYSVTRYCAVMAWNSSACAVVNDSGIEIACSAGTTTWSAYDPGTLIHAT